MCTVLEGVFFSSSSFVVFVVCHSPTWMGKAKGQVLNDCFGLLDMHHERLELLKAS